MTDEPQGPPASVGPPGPAELPSTLKVVILWLLLGTVLFLGFLWWEREQRRSSFSIGADGDVVELRRGADGHYHWPGKLNGRRVDFVVDTGATGVAIPGALARELDLPIEGRADSRTAGGAVRGDIVRADLELSGGVRVQRLRMLAMPALDVPLLGMDVLGRLPWQQRDDRLIIDLRPPDGAAAPRPGR